MWRRPVIFLLMGLLAGAVRAPGVAAGTLLRAGFEKGMDADESAGPPAATVDGAAARVEGRFGTSLVLGPGQGACRYPLAGNLDLSRGTLVAWVQPNGWRLGTPGRKVLFSAGDASARMALWWDRADGSLALARTAGGKRMAVSKPAYDWRQPDWHHLVLAWAPYSLALYVDGRGGQAAGPAAVAEVPSGQLTLGGDLGTGATLAVRGILVLGEPLSARGVQDRYRVAVSGRVEHERPILAVARCRTAPAIDGVLAPGEWDAAAGTAGFVEIAGGVLSGAATRVLLSYDGANLYLAFRCPFAGSLTGTRLARDTGSPWDDDCVEVFLQPEVGFTAKSYHLVLNAHGGLWDADDQNASWSMAGQWATTKGQKEWTAEMAVPHASLGTLPPGAGNPWQANFCRSIGSGGTANRHTCWAFTGGSYGDWRRFGSLRFLPAGPVARVDSLAAQPAQGAPITLRLSNPGRTLARVGASVLVYRAGMPEDCAERSAGPWELAPGASRTERVEVPGGFPADQVRVQVRSLDKGQVLLSQMVRSGSVAPAEAPAPAAVAVTPGGAPAAPRLTDEALGRVIHERALWQENRLGVTTKVPPPWTPMRAAGKTVSCWGRSFDFAGSLFPRQVRSANADLLSGAIALVARVAGKEVPIQRAARQSLTPAAHQVDLDGSTSAAGIAARVRTHLEYDGCAKVELSLAPAAGPVLMDSLELRIPVKAERALYYHWFEATRDPRLTNAGALPAAGLKSHFKPLLWLGDNDRGFCWFSESPKGWQINGKESVLRVERTQAGCVIRIRMVDRPFVLAAPWKTVFGLTATPTRPMPKGWRDWLIPLNQTNPWSAWWAGTFNNLSGTDDPGTLSPKDPEAMRAWVKDVQANGQPASFWAGQEPTKVIPYSQIVFWSGKHRDGMPSPEITAFGPEWSSQRRPPGPRTETEEQIPLKEYFMVCPASSFSQFYMHRLNQLIDQTGIDGIYIDGPWNTCANPLHGCGYQDDQGKWQAEFKIWAYRDLLKRVYCLFHEKRKDPIIHHHTSCWLCIPSISFSHMMLDGEQYHDAGQKVEEHFQDVVPLDKWRAEHTGRQWGPAPFILPDIPPEWARLTAPTRELLMLVNLHDVGLFPGGYNLRLAMRNYQARRLFGVADCRFRGYWESADWVRLSRRRSGDSHARGVTIATPGVRVSVYRKPDGSRCLLAIGNTAKTDAIAAVRPNLAALKLKGPLPDAGVDLETGDRVPIRNGVMALPVKGRDFRLIALPFYQAPPITAGDARAAAVRELPNPGFEKGLAGWNAMPLEGNTGRAALDTEVKASGAASCHLHKVEGPGGVAITTTDAFVVEPGKSYRANCLLRTANATGAKAYWMVAQQDAEGNTVGTNNLFSGFVTENQEWKPLPFEFKPLPGTAVIRVSFIVAFPGTMDAWVDDFTLVSLDG